MKTLEDSKISSSAIKGLREQDLALSQERFAHLLGVTLGTISRWERAEGRPDEAMEQKIMRLRRIARALLAVMDPKSAAQWLQAPLAQFDGNPPRDLLASNFATVYLERFIDQWLSGRPPKRRAFNVVIARMASDPAVSRECKKAAADFEFTDADGL